MGMTAAMAGLNDPLQLWGRCGSRTNPPTTTVGKMAVGELLPTTTMEMTAVMGDPSTVGTMATGTGPTHPLQPWGQEWG